MSDRLTGPTATTPNRPSGELPDNVLLDTDRAFPLVQLAVSSFRGATTDPEGKEGLTRLVTRLMRRTANGLTADEVDERIDAIGGSMGADVSSASSGFAGSVIARSLDPFSELLVGVLTNPSLDEAELARLKRETAAELQEALDSDRAIAQRWFRRAVFRDHLYGRSIVGTEKTIASIDEDDVREHYGRCFTRGELQFAFAGDIEANQAKALVERVNAGLPQGEQAAETLDDPEGPRDRTLWVIDKPERTQTQILIGGLGTHPADDDHTALLVANTVFGGTFTARLTQEIRAERGWSYGAYSSLPFDRRRQAFSMWTFPKATDAAPCIELQLKMLSDWIQQGITQDELDNAKSYLVKSNVFSLDTASKRMGQALDERLYQLPEDYFSAHPERVQSITLDDANAAIQRRISDQHLALVVVGTASDIAEPIRKVCGDLADFQVIPYDTE